MGSKFNFGDLMNTEQTPRTPGISDMVRATEKYYSNFMVEIANHIDKLENKITVLEAELLTIKRNIADDYK